jgi:hypothetical protein
MLLRRNARIASDRLISMERSNVVCSSIPSSREKMNVPSFNKVFAGGYIPTYALA